MEYATSCQLLVLMTRTAGVPTTTEAQVEWESNQKNIEVLEKYLGIYPKGNALYRQLVGSS